MIVVLGPVSRANSKSLNSHQRGVSSGSHPPFTSASPRAFSSGLLKFPLSLRCRVGKTITAPTLKKCGSGRGSLAIIRYFSRMLCHRFFSKCVAFQLPLCPTRLSEVGVSGILSTHTSFSWNCTGGRRPKSFTSPRLPIIRVEQSSLRSLSASLLLKLVDNASQPPLVRGYLLTLQRAPHDRVATGVQSRLATRINHLRRLHIGQLTSPRADATLALHRE